MASSPFNFFRKNQRTWMAALVIVAIVSFVIIPNIDSFVGPNSTGRPNSKTLVSWKGGTLNVAKLEKMNMVHAQTYNIFNRVAAEVLQAGGTPKVPGFAMTPQRLFIGIEEPRDTQSIIQVRLIAEAARKRGVVVDDHTVDQFIKNFTDRKISAKRFDEIIKEVAGQSLSKFDMYDFLRDEIAKQIFVQMGYGGLAFSQQPLVPPSKNWVNFQKFQQRAKVEAYPIFVDQYLAKVTTKPSDQELRQLYDKAKDRVAVPNSPEPGFRRRYHANVEYVMADLNTYLKDEEAKISDELLKSTYEKRVNEDGAYKVPVEEPKTPPTPPAADSPSTTTPSNQTKPDGSPTDTPKLDAPTPDSPKADDAKPTEETKDAKPAEQTKSGKKKTSKNSKNGQAPKSKESKAAEPASDSPASPQEETKEPSPNSSRIESFKNSKVKLVAFQNESDEKKAEATNETTAASESNTPKEAAAVPADAKDSEAKPSEVKVETKPERPMRVKTLEEVSQDLRRELAMPAAQQRLQQAINVAQERMDFYYNELQSYKTGDPKRKDIVKPAALNLAEVASQLGLSYGKTGMIDAAMAEDLPIGRSFTRLDPGQGGAFNFEMFAQSVYNNRLRLFQPATSQGFSSGSSQTFLFWKVEDQASRIPPFDEVREQVLTAWKMAEARKMATKAAEELAASLNTTTEADPWARLLDASQLQLLLKPPMFTWLQPMMTGNEGIQPSMVEGIDQPGPQFMERAFTTPPGKSAVAMDAAQQKCFVLRVVERSPSDEQLLSEFEKAPLNRGVLSLGSQQTQTVAERWFDSLVDDMKVDMSKLSSYEQ